MGGGQLAILGSEIRGGTALLSIVVNSIYLKLSTLVIPVAFSRVKKYFHLGYFLVCFQLIVRSQIGVDKRARLGFREVSCGQILGAPAYCPSHDRWPLHPWGE